MVDTSRRHALTAATIGAAAVALARPAGAQSASSGQARGGKHDPRNKYSEPPFKAQSQAWPGLANQMDPKPDYGETSYVGSGRWSGRKALITGGDSGMGRAAAIAYAREGADVAINYLPEEEPDAREVVDLIRQAGRKAVTIPRDLRTAAFCQDLVSKAISGLGGLDIVVCNAARQQSIPSLLDVTDDEFDRTMKTNIYAPFWIIRAALPHLEPGSVIIGTTSEQAYDPSPDLYAYAQTKAATMNYVKSLAKQLGSKGIRVNGVAPGPIWTPLQISGGAQQGKVVTFGATAPLGRPGQPAELAGIYVRLAEDDGSYTTGNIYGAAGGQGNRDEDQTDAQGHRRTHRRILRTGICVSKRTGGGIETDARVRTGSCKLRSIRDTRSRGCAIQSANLKVRAFAVRMLEDHQQIGKAVRDAAMWSGVGPPEMAMSADQAQLLGVLQSINGDEFDALYLKQQALAHRSALEVEQIYAKSGDDPCLQQLATSAAPLISLHGEMAKSLSQLVQKLNIDQEIVLLDRFPESDGIARHCPQRRAVAKGLPDGRQDVSVCGVAQSLKARPP